MAAGVGEEDAGDRGERGRGGGHLCTAPPRRPPERSRRVMHRHVARVVVVAVGLLLAAPGGCKRSAERGFEAAASPAEGTKPPPPPSVAPPPPPPLHCNASQGVSFFTEIQEVNGTTKSVLKILVKDDYNVTLLPPPPTPAPSRPSNPPPSQAPSSTTRRTTTTQRTTMPTPSRSVSSMRPPGPSWSSADSSEISPDDDDWDYLAGLVPDSKEDKILLAFERLRHDLRTNMRELEKYKKDMEVYCTEAAKDDNDVIQSDGSFHPQYEEVPGVGVYRLHARARSWEEARKVCEREGAQLAVPNSHTEAEALMEMHNRCPHLLNTHFNDYQYLGVHDLYSEGDWETVIGYPLNETGYINWAFNQPDNAHHEGENCLSMNRSGFFNDVPCWTELPFICEHP